MSILDHTDFRTFLNDFYQAQKSKKEQYSYRQLSQDFGFGASNYLYLTIQGKRNLSEDAIRKIQSHMHWSAYEKKYFETLVQFQQAKKLSEKEKWSTELKRLRQKGSKKISEEKFGFFSAWYIPVIHEILSFKNVVHNLTWLARKLQPKITEEEARLAIDVLERLGMVRKEKNSLIPVSENLTTEDEVTSKTIYDYHKQLLNLSLGSLELPSSERDVSSLTLSLTPEHFQKLKSKIISFRDEVLHEIEEKKLDPTLVALLNIQFFPLTKK